MKRLVSLIVCAVAFSQTASAQTEALSISCDGVANTTEAVGFGANSQILTAPRSNSATVIFKLEGGKAAIKLPSTLWHAKGDGWFQIQGLEVSSDAIKGRVPLSTFTKPRLQIDRMNGRMDLSSSTYLGSSFTFSGQCVVLTDASRKF